MSSCSATSSALGTFGSATFTGTLHPNSQASSSLSASVGLVGSSPYVLKVQPFQTKSGSKNSTSIPNVRFSSIGTSRPTPRRCASDGLLTCVTRKMMGFHCFTSFSSRPCSPSFRRSSRRTSLLAAWPRPLRSFHSAKGS